MRRMLVAVLVGMALGLLVNPPPLVAQVVARMEAVYNGLPMALLADSSGRLRVVCE